MPNLDFHFADDHTRVDVDGTLLGHLNLCLLQLPSSQDAVVDDAGRPGAVNALRDFLAGGPTHAQPALPQLIPGGSPVLIVAPEYAFGSSDWPAINVVSIPRQSRGLIGGPLKAALGLAGANRCTDLNSQHSALLEIWDGGCVIFACPS